VVAAAASLILGIARALNLAHGEMVLLGGYVTFALWQWTGLSPLLLAPKLRTAEDGRRIGRAA
jgi:branched-chain amino acid transport system permease protein